MFLSASVFAVKARVFSASALECASKALMYCLVVSSCLTVFIVVSTFSPVGWKLFECS